MFVASGYSDSGDFLTWTEDCMIGRVYQSIVVQKSVISQTETYTDLIGIDIQVLCMPINFVPTDGRSLIPTPHYAVFDNTTGTLEIQVSSDYSANARCDTLICLYSSGSTIPDPNSFGFQVHGSDGTAIIDKSYSNLVLREYVSLSNSNGISLHGGRIDKTEIQSSTGKYRLTELPTVGRVHKCLVEVFFTNPVDEVPVICVSSKNYWTFVSLNTNASGQYDSAVFYLPNGVGDAATNDDLEIALLTTLPASYSRVKYSIEKGDWSYGEAETGSYTSVYSTSDSLDRPTVSVYDSIGNNIFNSRYIPGGVMGEVPDMYLSDSLSHSVASSIVWPSNVTYTKPSITGGGVMLDLVEKKMVVAGTFNVIKVIEDGATWTTSNCNILGCFSHTDHASSGFTQSVMVVKNTATGIDRAYSAYNIEATKRSKTGSLLTDLANFFTGGMDFLASGSPKSTLETIMPPYVIANTSNLTSAGYPKGYAVSLYMPALDAPGISTLSYVSTGTNALSAAWDEVAYPTGLFYAETMPKLWYELDDGVAASAMLNSSVVKGYFNSTTAITTIEFNELPDIERRLLGVYFAAEAWDAYAAGNSYEETRFIYPIEYGPYKGDPRVINSDFEREIAIPTTYQALVDTYGADRVNKTFRVCFNTGQDLLDHYWLFDDNDIHYPNSQVSVFNQAARLFYNNPSFDIQNLEDFIPIYNPSGWNRADFVETLIYRIFSGTYDGKRWRTYGPNPANGPITINGYTYSPDSGYWIRSRYATRTATAVDTHEDFDASVDFTDF